MTIDELVDCFGAEDAAARLTERLVRLRPPGLGEPGYGPGLWPPVSPERDRIEGPPSPAATLLVFGAHATPEARDLHRVLEHVREHDIATVAIVWRHFPHPQAHPKAAMFALAAEAGAARNHFWALTMELLRVRHGTPAELDAALRRVGIDPERAVETMQRGLGADRIVADSQSALASGVLFSPTLFINGELYRGDLEPQAVCQAVDAAS
jgi:protein-disulfide isomerase